MSEVPKLWLDSWRVIELADGDRHLVGWNISEREGRVSSRIVQFDATTGRAVTATGRVYELVGKPGANADAEYTWATWCRINGVRDFVDVTDEVWVAMNPQFAH